MVLADIVYKTGFSGLISYLSKHTVIFEIPVLSLQ